MSTPPLMIVSGSSRVRTAAPLNHALYAGSIGVPYFFDVAPTRVDRIYFHKLEVIRAYLPLAEWLFWIDDDAFFTDFRVDLRQFLADAGDTGARVLQEPREPARRMDLDVVRAVLHPQQPRRPSSCSMRSRGPTSRR